jgi:hypothetical protein
VSYSKLYVSPRNLLSLNIRKREKKKGTGKDEEVEN